LIAFETASGKLRVFSHSIRFHDFARFVAGQSDTFRVVRGGIRIRRASFAETAGKDYLCQEVTGVLNAGLIVRVDSFERIAVFAFSRGQENLDAVVTGVLNAFCDVWIEVIRAGFAFVAGVNLSCLVALSIFTDLASCIRRKVVWAILAPSIY
jgi:hypothetical protein